MSKVQAKDTVLYGLQYPDDTFYVYQGQGKGTRALCAAQATLEDSPEKLHKHLNDESVLRIVQVTFKAPQVNPSARGLPALEVAVEINDAQPEAGPESIKGEAQPQTEAQVTSQATKVDGFAQDIGSYITNVYYVIRNQNGQYISGTAYGVPTFSDTLAEAKQFMQLSEVSQDYLQKNDVELLLIGHTIRITAKGQRASDFTSTVYPVPCSFGQDTSWVSRSHKNLKSVGDYSQQFFYVSQGQDGLFVSSAKQPDGSYRTRSLLQAACCSHPIAGISGKETLVQVCEFHQLLDQVKVCNGVVQRPAMSGMSEATPVKPKQDLQEIMLPGWNTCVLSPAKTPNELRKEDHQTKAVGEYTETVFFVVQFKDGEFLLQMRIGRPDKTMFLSTAQRFRHLSDLPLIPSDYPHVILRIRGRLLIEAEGYLDHTFMPTTVMKKAEGTQPNLSAPKLRNKDIKDVGDTLEECYYVIRFENGSFLKQVIGIQPSERVFVRTSLLAEAHRFPSVLYTAGLVPDDMKHTILLVERNTTVKHSGQYLDDPAGSAARDAMVRGLHCTSTFSDKIARIMYAHERDGLFYGGTDSPSTHLSEAFLYQKGTSCTHSGVQYKEVPVVLNSEILQKE